jgi:type IV pilus assembly protein PilB
MPVTEEIERLAVDRASAHEVQRTAELEGMRGLRYDGLAKATEGHSSIQEILRVAI